MLWCYILTKSRFTRLKMVRNKETGTFVKKGFEYNIDRNAVYTRKLLGFKTIFYSMYLENVRDPIVFDDKGYTIMSSDIPLNDSAKLFHFIMRGVEFIIIIILCIINLLIGIGIIMKVY